MKLVIDHVLHYKEMKSRNSSMLREIQWQYADMANGGDGGDTGFEQHGNRTCRTINYPDHPDSFFQEVCALMGWSW